MTWQDYIQCDYNMNAQYSAKDLVHIVKLILRIQVQFTIITSESCRGQYKLRALINNGVESLDLLISLQSNSMDNKLSKCNSLKLIQTIQHDLKQLLGKTVASYPSSPPPYVQTEIIAKGESLGTRLVKPHRKVKCKILTDIAQRMT